MNSSMALMTHWCAALLSGLLLQCSFYIILLYTNGICTIKTGDASDKYVLSDLYPNLLIQANFIHYAMARTSGTARAEIDLFNLWRVVTEEA